MKLILKKIRRDIFQSFGTFIAITVILCIGATFFIGLNYSYDQLNGSVEAEYTKSNLADLWVNVVALKDDDIKNIENQEGIKNAESRIFQNATLGDKDINLYSISENNEINKPSLKSGVLPKDKEIIVESDFAKQNKYSINDLLIVEINGEKQTLKISGIFQSAEFIFYNNTPSQPVPNHKNFGIGFVDESVFDNSANTFNQVVIELDKNAEEDKIKDYLESEYDKNITSIISQDKQQSFALVDSKLGFVKSVAMIFPIIFIVLGALVTFISMNRQVENQRSQIAIMKALGTSDVVIFSNFMLFSLLTSLVATLLGALIGTVFIPEVIMSTFEILFVFPEILATPFVHYCLFIFCISMITSTIATYFSCKKILRENPAQALRPVPPKKIKSSIFEKIGFIWNHLSYPHKLIVRNITMNKIRFVLSSVGVVFCVCIMISSFGLKSALDEVIDIEFNKIRTYDVELSLGIPVLEPSAIENTDIKYQDSYTATSILVNDEDTLINIISDNNHSLAIYDTTGKKIKYSNDGIYISQKFADEQNIEQNDSVDMTINSETITCKVLGLYNSYTSQGVYTTYDFLKSKNINIPVTRLLITAKNEKAVSGLLKSLQNSDDYYSVIDKEQQLIDYAEASQSTSSIFVIMIVASVLLLFTIIYNITSINIFERRRDVATEKVLGLLDKEIGRLILIENFILALFSLAVGFLFCNQFYILLCGSLTQENMQFPQQLDLTSIIYSSVLLIVFTYLANLFMKRKITRIDMIEALKSVE